MNNQLNLKEVNIGVDTGKQSLDIHIRPLNQQFTVANEPTGIKEAIKVIKKVKPTRIVIEATVGLEHAFVLACVKARLPIVVVNPVHIRRFAQSLGQFAKTDKLDTQSLHSIHK